MLPGKSSGAHCFLASWYPKQTNRPAAGSVCFAFESSQCCISCRDFLGIVFCASPSTEHNSPPPLSPLRFFLSFFLSCFCVFTLGQVSFVSFVFISCQGDRSQQMITTSQLGRWLDWKENKKPTNCQWTFRRKPKSGGGAPPHVRRETPRRFDCHQPD